MMKKLKNLILKDIASAKRDNIVIYMVIAPIIIAILMSIFIPSFEASSVILVTDSKDDRLTENLKDYGEVISYDNREEAIERIYQRDDAIGIFKDGDGFEVIVEGNEKEDVSGLTEAIIFDITKESKLAQYKYTLLGEGRSLLKEYTAILIILMAIMMSGMVAGFNIIFEKESGAIRALSITPIRLFHYLASRGIIILFLSLFISVISSIILLGFSLDYARLVIGIIFSSGLGIMLGFLIGGIADNQIKGIALVKIIALPFTIIPIASIFIPGRFKYFLYPFPNYWMFRIFTNVFIDKGDNLDFWLSNIITIAITAMLLLIMMFSFRKRLRFR